MTYKETILAQIQHKETPVVPYTLPFEESVGENIDAYYKNKSWRQSILPYMVNVYTADTDPKEVIDEKYVKDIFGGIWRQDMRPWHLEKPALTEPSFKGYTFPKAEQFIRPKMKEEAKEICKNNPNNFILAHLGWGLFERSWTLRGFENVLMDVVLEPDFFEEMLDKVMQLYLALIDYTADLPIDGILFGDDWGDQRGVIIGAERWRHFLKPRWAKLYEAVHNRGKLVLHHSCGCIAEIIPDLIEIKLDVLESVQPEPEGMNPYELKKKWGDKITFWGCLGSQSIIPMGTPDALRAEIAKLRSQMSKGGGYILAPAKPLQPETPVENAAAILEAFTGFKNNP